MPPQEGQSSLQEPNAASSAEFLDGMKKATIREAKKGKKSTRYNSYENNNAWKFHMMRLKKLREEKQRREEGDPMHTRLSANFNHSMSSEIKALVGDNHMRNSREYIYAHRESQGVMKRNNEGLIEKRNEESFLREMSTPKFMKIKNDHLVQSRIHKPGFVPRGSRGESLTAELDDESALTIDSTLRETNRHKEKRDKRHLSIHESLTMPLEELFDREELEARKVQGASHSATGSTSKLGNYAQPTKSSSYRYKGHHTYMHSSGAEWWDDRDSKQGYERSRGRNARPSRVSRQKTADQRRTSHAHTKRVARLVADYLLKPFDGHFVDRDSHYKIPGVHRSRRRSISVSRGLIPNEYGTGRGHDGANLRLVASMHVDGRMRSRSAGPAISGRPYSHSVDSAHPSLGLGGLESPASVTSRKSIFSYRSAGISTESEDVVSGGRPISTSKVKEKGRMSMLEASVPGMYRPLTAPSPGTLSSSHDNLQYHEYKQRRATGPWVPSGNRSKNGGFDQITDPDGELRTSLLSAHICVNQAGQERHDRMKYWISSKALKEKIRKIYPQKNGDESESKCEEETATYLDKDMEGGTHPESLEAVEREDELGRPSLTRRVSAATNAALSLDKSSTEVNLLHYREHSQDFVASGVSGSTGGNSSHSARIKAQEIALKRANKQIRKGSWLTHAKNKLDSKKSKKPSGQHVVQGDTDEDSALPTAPPPLPVEHIHIDIDVEAKNKGINTDSATRSLPEESSIVANSGSTIEAIEQPSPGTCVSIKSASKTAEQSPKMSDSRHESSSGNIVRPRSTSISSEDY